MERPCPFCGATTKRELCPACGRSVTARRIVCASCQKQTPKDEKACCHCGQTHKSDLRWKIPLIITLFVLAAVITILIEFAR